jgi:hypothetical protein
VTQSWGSINEPLIHGHEPTKAVNTYRGELPCVVPMVSTLPPLFTWLEEKPNGGPEHGEIFATRPYLVGQGQVIAVYFNEYDFVSLYVCIRDLPDPVSPDGGLPTDGSASNYWKKVDLDFPKRDPRTGNEADPRAHQYTNLIDPTPGDR